MDRLVSLVFFLELALHVEIELSLLLYALLLHISNHAFMHRLRGTVSDLQNPVLNAVAAYCLLCLLLEVDKCDCRDGKERRAQ